jgi:hypothetical protein
MALSWNNCSIPQSGTEEPPLPQGDEGRVELSLLALSPLGERVAPSCGAG